MPLLKRTSHALSAKLTRVTLDRFIAAHASRGLTLDIGAQNGPYAAAFPRRIAVDLRRGTGVQVLGDAQALGLIDGVFDVVLCTEVLEHLPEPQRAVDEMFRVLKPGGRVAVSDIVTNGPMSPVVAKGLEAWAACVAGALDVKDYRRDLSAAGFVEVHSRPKEGTANEVLAQVPLGMPYSALITARKP